MPTDAKTPAYRAVRRYLSLRLEKPPAEERVNEYIKRCRDEGLLPDSKWTAARRTRRKETKWWAPDVG